MTTADDGHFFASPAMVLQLHNKRVLPIGVDLGSSSAKLVQLRSAGAGLELLACGILEIPPEFREEPAARLNHFAQNLPGVLRSNHFRGRKCILGLPADCSFVRHVKVPRTDEKATEAAVHKAVRGELPYPVEEAVIRHIIAGEVYDKGEIRQEVIVVAMPFSTLDAYLGMTQRAGLEVVGINVEPLAIVECFNGLFGQSEQEASLFIDLGSDSTQVVISLGGKVVFARNLPSGANQVEQAIAQGLRITPEEAHQRRREAQAGNADAHAAVNTYLDPWTADLAEEVDLCLRYYEFVIRGRAVQRVIFTGGQARDRDLCKNLAEHLHLPAFIGNPLLGLSRSAQSLPDDPAGLPNLTVGIGLSISGQEN